MPGQVPQVTDERDGLLRYLAHQRDLARTTAFGLTDEQARLAPSASALSVGGVIKHLASTETNWIDLVVKGDDDVDIEVAAARYGEEFQLREEETLASVLHRYGEVAARTEHVIAGVADLDQPVPVPKGVPWYPDDVNAWSVRWVLLHLIEETARHVGHADIIRESVDGATWYELLAAAEGWPATDWLLPWEPPPPG